MVFDDIVKTFITFIKTNIPLSIVAGLFLVFILMRKPKLFFTAFVIFMFLVGVLYVVSYVSTIGVSYKKELLR